MIISILTFLWSLAFPALLADNMAHEFHVSKCQIEYSEPDSALQITLHIFIDDLEEALRQKGADKLYIATEREHKKAEVHLYEYLQEAFKFTVNKQAADFIFVGKEPSEDLQAIWCYLEIPNLNEVKDVSITNTILLEVFKDQKNIVSIIGPSKKQGYFLFEQGNSTETIHF